MEANIRLIKGVQFNYFLFTFLGKPADKYVCEVERAIEAINNKDEYLNMTLLSNPDTHISLEMSQLKPILERLLL